MFDIDQTAEFEEVAYMLSVKKGDLKKKGFPERRSGTAGPSLLFGFTPGCVLGTGHYLQTPTEWDKLSISSQVRSANLFLQKR